MLEQVLLHIHNRFIRDSFCGTYSITEGALPLEHLLDGQYFWIEGSVFNDGLHQNPAADLTDEIFTGIIRALAIPQQLIDLADEIADWCDKNSDALNSPYQSESFGGYSYTKASQSGSDSGGLSGWQAQFAGRLNPWRKLC